jgi:hypothetical protein
MSSKKLLDVAICGRQQMFGEQETIDGIPRATTCKCLTLTAEVLVISKTDFVKRV